MKNIKPTDVSWHDFYIKYKDTRNYRLNEDAINFCIEKINELIKEVGELKKHEK